MIKTFGLQLLDEIHQQTIPTQSIKLNSECKLKFQKLVKKAKNSRECTIDWFLRELINDQHMKENLGYIILKGLKTLSSEKIKNEPTLNESKSRKFERQSKQPDFVVSVIYQLQTESVIFVDKDCLDFLIDKGANINIIGFQYI
ncbi:13765_t:CDS:2, partial [Racocetra persica]